MSDSNDLYHLAISYGYGGRVTTASEGCFMEGYGSMMEGELWEGLGG